MTDVVNDTNLLNVVFDLPGLDTAIENVDNPSIAEGTYLAVIAGWEQKINPEKGSLGYNWSLVINLSANLDQWDSEARTTPFTHYTFIGHLRNGTVQYPNGQIFPSTAAMLRAAGVVGTTFKPADFIGNLVKVTIVWKDEADFNDPSRTVKRARISYVTPYFDQTDKPHKLAGVEQFAPVLDAATPAENKDGKPAF